MKKPKIRLRVMIPEKIMEDLMVTKVVAEAPNGFFCLKPNHIDFTSALKPGILYYYTADREYFMAVDTGILVKCGSEVRISVLNAVKGEQLDELERRVRREFMRIEHTEESASRALRKMEIDLLQHFIGLEKDLEARW